MSGNVTYDELSEEDLMVAYLKGDSAAFDALYDRTSDRLYGYLKRRLSSREQIDEIFQATFMKFHQMRLQYRPPLPVMPWLFTICRTVMIDGVRSQARRRETLSEDMDKYRNGEATKQVGAFVAQSSFSTDIVGLKTLSSSQKEALMLRFQQDLSFEEIAKRLETTPVNARQLISRALRRLKSFTEKKGTEK